MWLIPIAMVESQRGKSYFTELRYNRLFQIMFMTLFKACAFLLFYFLAVTADVAADSMKCGTRLVSTEDTKAEVFLKCGEPFWKEIVGEKTVQRRYFRFLKRSSTVIIEKWTYHFGYRKFLRILTFEGDKLVKIEIGDKP